MRPRLLDLFCGQGGAAMGYHRAGFNVVGLDIKPQPRYPFEFIRLDVSQCFGWLPLVTAFDVIHASPPCQRYARVTQWRGNAEEHPDLVAETRSALEATGLPFVIENVLEAPIRRDAVLCGTMFDLPIRRHRAFELSEPLGLPILLCNHSPDDKPFMHKQERAYADAMGCTWMTNRGGRQAIPPAYTEFIGKQLLAYIEGNERTAA